MAPGMALARIVARTSGRVSIARISTPTFTNTIRASRTYQTSAIKREELAHADQDNTHGVNHIPGSTTSPGSAEVVPPPTKETHVYVPSADGGKDKTEKVVHKPVESGPVSGGVADVAHKAQGLSAETISKLPLTMQRFTLNGKVAVVTGGGRGLGYNMAQALAEAGVEAIAIFDVQQELGEKAAKELADQTGIAVRFYKVDVRDQTAIQNSVHDVIEQFGRIDVLLSSAGIADSNIPAHNYPAEMFRRLIDINVTGTFLVAQAVAQKMIEIKHPVSMIFVASMSGSIVNYPQEQSCYNASKAAVVQLTRSLAAEWARYQIRVNAISPGYMDTALNRVPALDAQKRIWVDNTPQKRLGNVDELNNLAVFLASEGSSYMTGSNLLIDGGYTLW